MTLNQIVKTFSKIKKNISLSLKVPRYILEFKHENFPEIEINPFYISSLILELFYSFGTVQFTVHCIVLYTVQYTVRTNIRFAYVKKAQHNLKSFRGFIYHLTLIQYELPCCPAEFEHNYRKMLYQKKNCKENFV
jgi:hypothetical protein